MLGEPLRGICNQISNRRCVLVGWLVHWKGRLRLLAFMVSNWSVLRSESGHLDYMTDNIRCCCCATVNEIENNGFELELGTRLDCQSELS